MTNKIESSNLSFILMGNEAIGRGLVENGVHFVSAYPGTPSSEILPSVINFASKMNLSIYCEWSINEKVALEIALSSSYTGKRSACIMKQVGLNVALDPLMSSAYIGVKGGFIIISADDPGPHSSQTEQDSRLLAYFAKIPVLDPDSPEQARDLTEIAFFLSEKFEIPILIRPVLRVCHSRQKMRIFKPKVLSRQANFERNPARWAAIPKMRFELHKILNKKIKKISNYIEELDELNIWHSTIKKTKNKLGILASGFSAALMKDILTESRFNDINIPFLQVLMPYPPPLLQINKLLNACDKVLVLEETEPVLELLIPQRNKLIGRFNGVVPSHGEITPDIMKIILKKSLKISNFENESFKPQVIRISDKALLKQPNLCPGCSHRAVFWTMKRYFPTGIFPSDIGCYTLGLNQKAVDTCHDMGAAITFASSISKSYQLEGKEIPVIATIGDSTFYHSGVSGLINAVYNGFRFVLVILNNETTSMTGMQPTPEKGFTADGHKGNPIDMIKLIKGCGVNYVKEVDPYDLKTLSNTLKKAYNYSSKPENSVAVIVARHECISNKNSLSKKPTFIPVEVRTSDSLKKELPSFNDNKKCIDCNRCLDICFSKSLEKIGKTKFQIDKEKCKSCGLCSEVCPTGFISLEPAFNCVGCGKCLSYFSCPALSFTHKGFIQISSFLCVGCGLCRDICFHKAFVSIGGDS